MRTREVIEAAELLERATDVEAVVAHFGAVRERVGDWLVVVEPREPRHREVRLERSARGELAGIVVILAGPEAIRWDQIDQRFGPSAFVPSGTSHGSAPPARSYHQRGEGRTTLLAARADGDRIASFALRKTGLA